MCTSYVSSSYLRLTSTNASNIRWGGGYYTISTLMLSLAPRYTNTVLDETYIPAKFGKCVAMVKLLFVIPILDAAGNVVQIDPLLSLST